MKNKHIEAGRRVGKSSITNYLREIFVAFNMIVLRPSTSDLSAFSFAEKDNQVVFQDTNGDSVPLDKVVIETQETTFNIKSLPKNKLSELMCTPLAETDKFYVVRK